MESATISSIVMKSMFLRRIFCTSRSIEFMKKMQKKKMNATAKFWANSRNMYLCRREYDPRVLTDTCGTEASLSPSGGREFNRLLEREARDGSGNYLGYPVSG